MLLHSAISEKGYSKTGKSLLYQSVFHEKPFEVEMRMPGQMKSESMMARARRSLLKAVFRISGIDSTQIDRKFPTY